MRTNTTANRRQLFTRMGTNPIGMLLGAAVVLCAVLCMGALSNEDQDWGGRTRYVAGSDLRMERGARTNDARIVDLTTTAARTIFPSESGTTFVMADVAEETPVARTYTIASGFRIGDTVEIVDNDPTAAADATIDFPSGEGYNAQTAGVTIVATGDAAGEVLQLRKISATRWLGARKVGTWTQGS